METEPLPPAVVTETAPEGETVIVGRSTLPEKLAFTVYWTPPLTRVTPGHDEDADL